MNKDIAPVYHGKRTFLGLKDLVISLFTRKCQFQCSFCDLPLRSAEYDVPAQDVIKQIHWVFDQYEDEIETFRQLSVGNEGSILDSKRMLVEAMDYLLERARNEIFNLEVLSLETRPEYIKEKILEEIVRKTNAKTVDVTVGFETQDDILRNDVLKKQIRKDYFERKVKLLGNMGIRLTSYVMLKPSPLMTEKQGISEAIATIDYLYALCHQAGTDLVIYLNPTYIARGSPLAQAMGKIGYKPPKIQSVMNVILHAYRIGVPIYTGLWSENLADEGGDYTAQEDYDKNFRRAIKNFNKTQDPKILREFLDK